MAISLGDTAFPDDYVDAGVFEGESDPSTDAKEDEMVKETWIAEDMPLIGYDEDEEDDEIFG